MKQLLIFTSLALILFSYSSKKAYNMQSIKGRWYFVENGIYKEIHANDSILYLFDTSNDYDQVVFNIYYFTNDTLWSFYPYSHSLTEKTPPHFWGKVIKFQSDSVVFKKEPNKMVLHKIDMVDSLFSFKLDQFRKDRVVDSVKYKLWIGYQNDYWERAIEFLKHHPEMMYKGEL